MMKNETKMTDTTSPEAIALTAACQLHSDLLRDDAFEGYDGTKHQFDLLFQELLVIARDEVSLEIEPVNQVIETFYDYQMEISAGVRDMCWFYRVPTHSFTTTKQPMNLTELLAFCKSWGDLSSPFYHNHFVYATDGNLAIRIPAENLNDYLPEKGNRNVAELAEKLDSYFATDYSGKEPRILIDFDFDLETELCEHCEGEGVLYACAECDGAGEVGYSTDYNDYEDTCQSCNGKSYFARSEWEDEFGKTTHHGTTEDCDDCGGTGVKESNPDVYVDEVRFQGKLLKKFMQFEGATITISEQKKPALIKWAGGEGILMPMLARE